MSGHIMESFDSHWRAKNIEGAASRCPDDEILPVLLRHARPGARILESGCGSGAWVLFLRGRGYDVTGLDWSPETVAAAKRRDATIPILVGDARRSPFPDASFDLVLSFGTVEHAVEGPSAALRDAFRVLKPGGVLIATVPILTAARRILRAVKDPIRALRDRREAREASRRGLPFQPLAGVKRVGLPGLYLMATRGKEGYEFFEYRFPPARFAAEVRAAGFEVLETRPIHRWEGVFHDLYPFSGRWDYDEGAPRLTLFARLIGRLLPGAFRHMVLCVGKKP